MYRGSVNAESSNDVDDFWNNQFEEDVRDLIDDIIDGSEDEPLIESSESEDEFIIRRNKGDTKQKRDDPDPGLFDGLFDGLSDEEIPPRHNEHKNAKYSSHEDPYLKQYISNTVHDNVSDLIHSDLDPEDSDYVEEGALILSKRPHKDFIGPQRAQRKSNRRLSRRIIRLADMKKQTIREVNEDLERIVRKDMEQIKGSNGYLNEPLSKDVLDYVISNRDVSYIQAKKIIGKQRRKRHNRTVMVKPPSRKEVTLANRMEIDVQEARELIDARLEARLEKDMEIAERLNMTIDDYRKMLAKQRGEKRKKKLEDRRRQVLQSDYIDIPKSNRGYIYTDYDPIDRRGAIQYNRLRRDNPEDPVQYDCDTSFRDIFFVQRHNKNDTFIPKLLFRAYTQFEHDRNFDDKRMQYTKGSVSGCKLGVNHKNSHPASCVHNFAVRTGHRESNDVRVPVENDNDNDNEGNSKSKHKENWRPVNHEKNRYSRDDEDIRFEDYNVKIKIGLNEDQKLAIRNWNKKQIDIKRIKERIRKECLSRMAMINSHKLPLSHKSSGEKPTHIERQKQGRKVKNKTRRHYVRFSPDIIPWNPTLNDLWRKLRSDKDFKRTSMVIYFDDPDAYEWTKHIVAQGSTKKNLLRSYRFDQVPLTAPIPLVDRLDTENKKSVDTAIEDLYEKARDSGKSRLYYLSDSSGNLEYPSDANKDVISYIIHTLESNFTGKVKDDSDNLRKVNDNSDNLRKVNDGSDNLGNFPIINSYKRRREAAEEDGRREADMWEDIEVRGSTRKPTRFSSFAKDKRRREAAEEDSRREADMWEDIEVRGSTRKPTRFSSFAKDKRRREAATEEEVKREADMWEDMEARGSTPVNGELPPSLDMKHNQNRERRSIHHFKDSKELDLELDHAPDVPDLFDEDFQSQLARGWGPQGRDDNDGFFGPKLKDMGVFDPKFNTGKIKGWIDKQYEPGVFDEDLQSQLYRGWGSRPQDAKEDFFGPKIKDMGVFDPKFDIHKIEGWVYKQDEPDVFDEEPVVYEEGDLRELPLPSIRSPESVRIPEYKENRVPEAFDLGKSPVIKDDQHPKPLFGSEFEEHAMDWINELDRSSSVDVPRNPNLEESRVPEALEEVENFPLFVEEDVPEILPRAIPEEVEDFQLFVEDGDSYDQQFGSDFKENAMDWINELGRSSTLTGSSYRINDTTRNRLNRQGPSIVISVEQKAEYKPIDDSYMNMLINALRGRKKGNKRRGQLLLKDEPEFKDDATSVFPIDPRKLLSTSVPLAGLLPINIPSLNNIDIMLNTTPERSFHPQLVPQTRMIQELNPLSDPSEVYIQKPAVFQKPAAFDLDPQLVPQTHMIQELNPFIDPSEVYIQKPAVFQKPAAFDLGPKPVVGENKRLGAWMKPLEFDKEDVDPSSIQKHKEYKTTAELDHPGPKLTVEENKRRSAWMKPLEFDKEKVGDEVELAMNKAIADKNPKVLDFVISAAPSDVKLDGMNLYRYLNNQLGSNGNESFGDFVVYLLKAGVDPFANNKPKEFYDTFENFVISEEIDKGVIKSVIDELIIMSSRFPENTKAQRDVFELKLKMGEILKNKDEYVKKYPYACIKKGGIINNHELTFDEVVERGKRLKFMLSKLINLRRFKLPGDDVKFVPMDINKTSYAGKNKMNVDDLMSALISTIVADIHLYQKTYDDIEEKARIYVNSPHLYADTIIGTRGDNLMTVLLGSDKFTNDFDFPYLVEMLTKGGTDLDHKNMDGDTAYHKLLNIESSPIFGELSETLFARVNTARRKHTGYASKDILSVRNNSNKTPIDLAIMNKDTRVPFSLLMRRDIIIQESDIKRLNGVKYPALATATRNFAIETGSAIDASESMDEFFTETKNVAKPAMSTDKMTSRLELNEIRQDFSDVSDDDDSSNNRLAMIKEYYSDLPEKKISNELSEELNKIKRDFSDVSDDDDSLNNIVLRMTEEYYGGRREKKLSNVVLEELKPEIETRLEYLAELNDDENGDQDNTKFYDEDNELRFLSPVETFNYPHKGVVVRASFLIVVEGKLRLLNQESFVTKSAKDHSGRYYIQVLASGKLIANKWYEAKPVYTIALLTRAGKYVFEKHLLSNLYGSSDREVYQGGSRKFGYADQ